VAFGRRFAPDWRELKCGCFALASVTLRSMWGRSASARSWPCISRHIVDVAAERGLHVTSAEGRLAGLIDLAKNQSW